MPTTVEICEQIVQQNMPPEIAADLLEEMGYPHSANACRKSPGFFQFFLAKSMGCTGVQMAKWFDFIEELKEKPYAPFQKR